MISSEVEIRILRYGDEGILANVSDGVFDNPIDPQRTTEFLSDPNHHIAAAIDNGIVVGFVSAVCYVHPDKQPELWLNEAGVASSHQGQGIAKSLLRTMLEIGRELNCGQAWVLTNRSNVPAMKLYASVGGKEDADDIAMFNFDLYNDSQERGKLK